MAARAVAAAYADYLAGGCDDGGPAAAMLALAAGVLQDLGELARQQLEEGRRRAFDDAVADALCIQAVAADRAAFPRPRRGLRSV